MMNDDIRHRLHSDLRKNFIPLPQDINTPLSSEQLNHLFPNTRAWNDVIALTVESENLKAQPAPNTEKGR
jgi:hypothetical protein